MCGICGFYSSEIREKEPFINEMMSVLSHRGPDDRKSFIQGHLALGHTRLAIIDIENGQQPVVSRDGRFTLVLNGEIYNYIELREQLKKKGYDFRTNSDAEVLLMMYLEYNKFMLEHLMGMFALAIFDKVENTLFIARDHFGIKPLYYYSDASLFAFASEIKALLKLPKIRPIPDEKSIHEYLTFQYILKSNTLFKDIYKVNPATYLIIKDGLIIEEQEYWKLDYEIDDSIHEGNYTDRLFALLDESVSLHMRADVHVGAYLSGGLDSSTIAYLASTKTNGSISTFTGAFKESAAYDESRFAKIVNEHIGGTNHLTFPTSTEFADNIEDLIYHMDEPAAGPGIFPQYMVSKMAAKKVKVILGGQGGDEIFGGYARYIVAYFEQCVKSAIYETHEEGKYVVSLNSIIENLPFIKQYVPLLKSQFSSGLFESMDKRYYKLVNRSHQLNAIYTDDFVAARDEEELFEKFSEIFNYSKTKSYLNKMTHFDLKTSLPALLQVEDRMSMAVSMETRVPFLDPKIAEFVSSIPPPVKFGKGQLKHSLLQTVKNKLPKEITERKDKMGFPTPINEWFSGDLKEYILDILTSQAARERGILHTSVLEKQIAGDGNFKRDIWGALNLELWFRKFIDNN